MKTREQKSFGYYGTSSTEKELKEKFLDMIDDIYEQHRKQKCRESSERLKAIEDEYKQRKGIASYCEFKLFEKVLELCRDLVEDNENLKSMLHNQLSDEGKEMENITLCKNCVYEYECIEGNYIMRDDSCIHFVAKEGKE